jgi:glycosyltransferase involved in cell wall biosynthesis
VYEGRLGSSRADSTFVLKNARCFSRIAKTSIWVSKRKGWNIPALVLQEYDVTTLGKTFDPKTLISSIFHQLLFGFAIRRNLKKLTPFGNQSWALVFHDWWPLIPLLAMRKRRKPIILLEVHRSLPRILIRMGAFSHIDLFVATNMYKFAELKSVFEGKMIYERNAVDLSDYDKAIQGRPKRRTKRVSILYTGSLGPEKNPDILLAISERMPALDFIIVGSIPKKWQEKQLPKNLILIGPKPHSQIALHQVNADLLLVTLDPNYPQSALYTSTMKLFEYIAAKKPIIAPSLASVLEVLSLEEFYSYEAGSVNSLENALLLAIKDMNHPKLPKAEHLSSISWQDRNTRILAELRKFVWKVSG